jgi:hypothetical protein
MPRWQGPPLFHIEQWMNWRGTAKCGVVTRSARYSGSYRPSTTPHETSQGRNPPHRRQRVVQVSAHKRRIRPLHPSRLHPVTRLARLWPRVLGSHASLRSAWRSTALRDVTERATARSRLPLDERSREPSVPGGHSERHRGLLPCARELAPVPPANGVPQAQPDWACGSRALASAAPAAQPHMDVRPAEHGEWRTTGWRPHGPADPALKVV